VAKVCCVCLNVALLFPKILGDPVAGMGATCASQVPEAALKLDCGHHVQLHPRVMHTNSGSKVFLTASAISATENEAKGAFVLSTGVVKLSCCLRPAAFVPFGWLMSSSSRVLAIDACNPSNLNLATSK